MTLPSVVLDDALSTLWSFVRKRRDVPLVTAAQVHDAIAALEEMILAMEARFLAEDRVRGETGPSFPDVPTIAARRSAALTRAGNVVWLPLTPRSRPPGEVTISGCFTVRPGGDAA